MTKTKETTATSQKQVKVTAKKKLRVKEKKPEEAPKRFKSAYMFYSIHRHPEIKKKYEKSGVKIGTTQVAKIISKEWKELPREEIEKWKAVSREDNERYVAEKSLYSGPWRVPAKEKRKAKDPDAPKRPMSAFLAFSNPRRSEMRSLYPGLSNSEICKKLANIWKELPDEDKKEYVDKEYKERQEYLVAVEEWRKKDAAKLQEEREKREEYARSVAAKRKAEESCTAATIGGSFTKLSNEVTDGPIQPIFQGSSEVADAPSAATGTNIHNQPLNTGSSYPIQNNNDLSGLYAVQQPQHSQLSSSNLLGLPVLIQQPQQLQPNPQEAVLCTIPGNNLVLPNESLRGWQQALRIQQIQPVVSGLGFTPVVSGLSLAVHGNSLVNTMPYIDQGRPVMINSLSSTLVNPQLLVPQINPAPPLIPLVVGNASSIQNSNLELSTTGLDASAAAATAARHFQ